MPFAFKHLTQTSPFLNSADDLISMSKRKQSEEISQALSYIPTQLAKEIPQMYTLVRPISPTEERDLAIAERRRVGLLSSEIR